MTIDDHPYVPLLFGPSPVHRLERLRAELGGRAEIWAQARGLQLRPDPALADHGR